MKGSEAPEWFLRAHVTLGKHRSTVLLSGSLISKAMGRQCSSSRPFSGSHREQTWDASHGGGSTVTLRLFYLSQLHF